MHARLLLATAALAVTTALGQQATFTTQPSLQAASPVIDAGRAAGSKDQRITVVGDQLRIGEKAAWLVAGELDYSTVPQADWSDQLMLLKSSGVTLVMLPVRWEKHLAQRGQGLWTGQHDLEKVLELCSAHGLKVVLCVGPAVRRGATPAYPSWLRASSQKPRTNEATYLAGVGDWYTALARQVSKRLWSNGGPVIGLELESSAGIPASHLEALRQLAISRGLEAPIFLATPSSEKPQLPEGVVSYVTHNVGATVPDLLAPGKGRISILHSGISAPVPMADASTRRFYLMLEEFGHALSTGTAIEADKGVLSQAATLLSDGRSGFILLDNRGTLNRDVSFTVNLHATLEEILVPADGTVRLPAGARALWPFNLPLGPGLTLGYATATPICSLEVDGVHTVFLAAPREGTVSVGIAAQLGVSARSDSVPFLGIISGNHVFNGITPSRSPAVEILRKGQLMARLIVISDTDSLNMRKVHWLGEERVVIWNGLLTHERDSLGLYDRSGRVGSGPLLVYPSPREQSITLANKAIPGAREGIFTRYDIGGKRTASSER